MLEIFAFVHCTLRVFITFGLIFSKYIRFHGYNGVKKQRVRLTFFSSLIGQLDILQFTLQIIVSQLFTNAK